MGASSVSVPSQSETPPDCLRPHLNVPSQQSVARFVERLGPCYLIFGHGCRCGYEGSMPSAKMAQARRAHVALVATSVSSESEHLCAQGLTHEALLTLVRRFWFSGEKIPSRDKRQGQYIFILKLNFYELIKPKSRHQWLGARLRANANRPAGGRRRPYMATAARPP